MPVYRYRLAQVNLTRIGHQIPQADVGSLVAGDSAAPLYWDITVNASAKTDLDSYMASLGWEFVSTDPTSTVEEVSASVFEKTGGSGRKTPESPLSLGGANQLDVAAGTGVIGYNGSYHEISWNSTNINTTGYAEGAWYVYVDNTETVQHSQVEPDDSQYVRLGGFYYTGMQIGDFEQDPARVDSFMSRVHNLGRVLGAFIANNGGLVQEMVTDLKIVAPACTVQYGLEEYNLTEVDSDDIGTRFFCWYNSADDGWSQEYFWLNFSSGKIPTDRWNDTTQDATTALSASCTFTNGSTNVSTASDLTSEVAVGDVVWLDADSILYMNRVVSINATTITLEENYGGTGGSGASSVGKALPNLTAGKYVKHMVFRTRSDKMHLILGQQEYDTLDEARDAGGPSIPEAISQGTLKMAFTLVQQGDTALDGGLIDIRPLPFHDTIGGSQGAGVITVHGDLSGLSNDDHTQYHNNTRGDARYYQKTEFLNTSTGAPDAGKPIKLDAAGVIDSTMLSGYVAGPASATDEAVARYDGTTGKLIQNSDVRINDSGNVGIIVAPSSTNPLRVTGVELPDFGVNVGSTTSYDNYDVDDYTNFSFHSATGDFEITGLASAVQGKLVIIHNSTDYTCTIRHEDAGSTTGNRFDLPNDDDIVLPPNGSISVTYCVQGSGSRWRMNSSISVGGESYAVTVSAWTLSSGRYYADVTHNLGTTDVFVEAYRTSDNQTVLLDEINRTSTNVVRVWVVNTANLRILVTVGGGAGVGAGTDTDAIHDNVASEISAISEKTTPVFADLLIIEDSADSNNKKKVQVGNLPGGLGGGKSFFADQFITPVGTDWDVNAAAPLQTDATNSAILVRAFDASTDEAVGFILDVPSGATNVRFTTRARARSAQTANAILRFSRREIPDNAAIGSWANYALFTVAIPNNIYFQKDTVQNTLATFGLTAGRLYQCQLFRDADVAGDTLTVDLDLAQMTVEFT